MELERKKVNFEIKEFDDESGVFEGYASTWGVDLGNDQIIKGAFSETITKRKDKNQVKLLPLHQWTFPLGKILELREDEKGLYVKAKLLPTEGELGGKNARMLMQEGVLNEMSIGFTTEDSEVNDSGTRIIKSIDLFEISLVLFGMNPETEVTSVKSILENQALKEMQNEIVEIKTILTLAKDSGSYKFENIEDTYEDEKGLRKTFPEEKIKTLQLFRKELNEKDSLNTMLENKLKEKLNVERGLYIMEIFLDEVIFNYYNYTEDGINNFDKYMRQGYTVRDEGVELVGDMVEVELGRVFTDKKDAKALSELKEFIGGLKWTQQ